MLNPYQIADLIIEKYSPKQVLSPTNKPQIEIQGIPYNGSSIRMFLNSGETHFPGCPQNYLNSVTGMVFQRLVQMVPIEKLIQDVDSSKAALRQYVEENLTLVADINSSDMYAVYNHTDQKIELMEPEHYCQIKGKRGLDPGLFTWGRVSYDPYVETVSWNEELYPGVPGQHFNLHVAPAWRKRPDDPAAKCPVLIDRFLSHFFENEPSRQFCLNWLRESIWGRNQTVLCFNGAKGTGKNFFATLWKALVGPANYHTPDKKIVESHFLGELKNRRAIFIDEARINTDEAENFIKIICNDEATLPEKHKNTTSTSRIDFSIIIAANREIDLRVEEKDRRFSVPEITSVPLKTVWTQGEIDRLWAVVEDEDEVYRFGQYLKHHCDFSDRWAPDDAYKEERFRRLCLISLREWESFVLDYILERVQKGVDHFQFLEMASDYEYAHKKHRLSQRAVSGFIKQPYRGIALGQLRMGQDRQFIIQINEELMKSPDTVKEWMKDLYEFEDDVSVEVKPKPKVNLGSFL